MAIDLASLLGIGAGIATGTPAGYLGAASAGVDMLNKDNRNKTTLSPVSSRNYGEAMKRRFDTYSGGKTSAMNYINDGLAALDQSGLDDDTKYMISRKLNRALAGV